MDKGVALLARRYAQAYLDLFFDTLAPSAQTSFYKAADLLAQKPHMGFLLDLAIISNELKNSQIQNITRSCALPLSSTKIIDLLLEHKRGSLLPKVLHQIGRLYEQRAGLDTCVVKSATPLLDHHKKAIEHAFQKQVPATLTFVYAVEPKLIAGISCQTSTVQWEDSVDKKIRRLEQLLKR